MYRVSTLPSFCQTYCTGIRLEFRAGTAIFHARFYRRGEQIDILPVCMRGPLAPFAISMRHCVIDHRVAYRRNIVFSSLEVDVTRRSLELIVNHRSFPMINKGSAELRQIKCLRSLYCMQREAAITATIPNHVCTVM